MSELRKDPVIGRWVIIASERARRPGNFVDTSDNDIENENGECSFCNNTRELIDCGFPSNGVSVVLSKDSVSDPKKEFHRTKQGLYDVIDQFGVHEIVIETPEHLANIADLNIDQIASVFKVYAARMAHLEKDKRFQYVLAYKNYGPTAGGRNIGHTCSHIVATPVQPLRVKEKLVGAKEYFEANKRCIYCDLIRQELESQERIVTETQHFVALIPFAARFLFETWVLPKDHNCNFHNGIKGCEKDLALIMKILLQKYQKGLDDPSYNFVIQTAPFRRTHSNAEKWKTIGQDYHWHIELMPRLTRVAGFEKGTGFYICSIPPEDMAEYLRDVHV